MVTAEDVRRLAITLPRTEEHLIRDQVKFRVGRIVYIAIASWSWRRGAWSSRNGSPRPTSATDAARLGDYAAHLSD
jgi:hypothetical protein